jgi:hypothetical protein
MITDINNFLTSNNGILFLILFFIVLFIVCKNKTEGMGNTTSSNFDGGLTLDSSAGTTNHAFDGGLTLDSGPRSTATSNMSGVVDLGPHTYSDPKNWTHKGCWRDTLNRSVETPKGSNYTHDKCREAAEAAGHNTYALQANGQCFIGNNSEYDKYGKIYDSNINCDTQYLGGRWINNVFVKDKSSLQDGLQSAVTAETLNIAASGLTDLGKNLDGCFKNFDVYQERAKSGKERIVIEPRDSMSNAINNCTQRLFN